MAYDGKIMRRALRRFEEDKKRREENTRKRAETIYAREPRLREIDRELRTTVGRIVTSALHRGADPRPALKALSERNLALQKERTKILEGLGLSGNCLDEKPNCPLCGDTGYRNGEVCRCLREYYSREQKKELSQMLDLGSQSFETFSLDWYSDEYRSDLGFSPRENMEWVKKTCSRFAEEFNPGGSGNLLLSGAPGLGKTFLSACIAREVSDAGFSVVYDTAVHVFERFEVQKFGRDDATEDVNRILTCDLLILDDLGTEMLTAFVQSALYQIVNTRLAEKRSAILNTNLSVEEISQRYTPQIASRIEGEYHALLFFGKDIRKLKNGTAR